MRHKLAAQLVLVGTVASIGGCGGGSVTPPPPPPPPPGPTIAAASPSGADQIGAANATLPNPLRVIVTQGGSPVSGRAVDWTIQNGGSVNPTQSTTGSDGVATTVVTLGTQPVMTITANATGATGGPVQFAALAAGSAATVQVVNNRFEPQTIAVRTGGRVTFEWANGATQHNLVPDDGKAVPNDATVRDGPFTVDVVFGQPGEYFYHCGVHGNTRSGMFGKIVVVP